MRSEIIAKISSKFRSLEPYMDERMRRQWAACEVQTLGRGGLSAVSRALGMSVNTIHKGLRELAARKDNPQAPVEVRLRRPGGGRKRRSDSDPQLLGDLEALVETGTRGDPESLLRWTCKSTTNLAQQLCKQGHQVSPSTCLLYTSDAADE